MSPGRCVRNVIFGVGFVIEQMLDGRHSLHQPFLAAWWQRGQHSGDIIVRRPVQLPESQSALAVRARLYCRLSVGDALRVIRFFSAEGMDDAAQVTGIESEFCADLLRGHAVLLRSSNSTRASVRE
jgi:hypothetical protein